MDQLQESLGYKYLQDTKFDRNSIRSSERLQIAPAPTFKQTAAEKIDLPRDWQDSGTSLWQALQSRRSIRKYGAGPINLKTLAQLLWATQGITARSGPYSLRTAPSAGALYPVETYLAINRVTDLAAGIYHFAADTFQLTAVAGAEKAAGVPQACLDQSFMGKAAVIFAWSAVFRRNMSKYGHRGLRYVLLDAGHICQNLLIAAEGLELCACPVAAFYDDELNGLFGLDGDEESVLYLAAVGRKV